MKANGVINKLVPILSLSSNSGRMGMRAPEGGGGGASADLTNATVRLLLNLSFDSELRNQMVKAGMLPKLVQLMADTKHQNPICCVLYHLSIDDKGKTKMTKIHQKLGFMDIELAEKLDKADNCAFSLAPASSPNSRIRELHLPLMITSRVSGIGPSVV